MGINKLKTSTIVLIIVGVFVFLSISVLILVNILLTNSKPYKMSINAIETNKEIKAEIGQITGYGYLPNGSVNISNGKGKADFCIKVEGTLKKKTICTKLKKSNNSDWKLIDLR